MLAEEGNEEDIAVQLTNERHEGTGSPSPDPESLLLVGSFSFSFFINSFRVQPPVVISSSIACDSVSIIFFSAPPPFLFFAIFDIHPIGVKEVR